MRAVLCMLALAVASWAGTIVFATAPGSVNPLDPQPVFARAVFDTHPGVISVTLENLLANPQSVSQSLSGVAFMVWPGPTQDATLAGSAAEAIEVNRGGSYQTLGMGSTGWGLALSTNIFQLCALCGAPPAYTLLGGPGPGGIYAAANRSIAGSAPHNPFLTDVAVFTIAAPGVTGATQVRQTVFSFGTAPGAGVAGVPDAAIPEPGALLPVATGLVLIWLLSSAYARKMGSACSVCRPARHRAGSGIAVAPEADPTRADRGQSGAGRTAGG